MDMTMIPYVIEQTGRGERSYDIFSRLLNDRIIMLNDQVDNASASVIIAAISAKNVFFIPSYPLRYQVIVERQADLSARSRPFPQARFAKQANFRRNRGISPTKPYSKRISRVI